MARLKRCCPAGIPQHVIQRGNNQQVCFTCSEDMAAYAHWLFEASSRYGVLIHAWVFMTNHVHLLATPAEEGGLSKLFQYIGRHYVRYFNSRYHRSGTLWEGRFKSQALLDERALLACMAYVDLNPIRAAIALSPEQSEYTSIQERIQHPATTTLRPFGGPSERDAGLPYGLKDYLELVDWTGRMIRNGRRGFIGRELPPILSRLQISPEQWRINTTQFEAIHARRFSRIAPNIDTG